MKKNKKDNEFLVLLLKGVILGSSTLVPGLSAGTFAVVLGIYEKLIGVVSNLTKDLKNNILYVLPIGLGALVAMLLGSNVVSFLLEHYHLATMLLFLGVIIGGIPLLFRRVKGHEKEPTNIIVFLIAFALIIIMYVANANTNNIDLSNINIIGYIKMVIVAAISAAAMIIPGVSGSFMLMLFGYFEPIINTVKDLKNMSLLTHNLSILIPFGIGVIVGILLISKVINYLLKHHEAKTFSAVLGFVIASIVTIVWGLVGTNINIIELLVGDVLAMLGCMLSLWIGRE